jgi:hypothetical protein
MVQGEVRVNDTLTGQSELVAFEYDPARETQMQAAGRASSQTIARWHNAHWEVKGSEIEAKRAKKRVALEKRMLEARKHG